jgi:hypothetical protein
VSTSGKGGDALTTAGRIRGHESGRAFHGLADGEASLAMPKRRTRTQEERDDAARLEAEMNAAGTREVAWLAARRHACKRRKRSDPPCRDSRHAGDVEAGRDALMALGLVADPAAGGRKTDLGFRERAPKEAAG